MDFGALFAPITTFLDSHPSVQAWLLGWVAALGFAQTFKQLVLPGWWSTTAAKRATQLVAMLSGGFVTYVLWPDGLVRSHRVVFGIVVGMSAPTAYTLVKALIEWQFPRLAYLLSWQRVQDREADAMRTDGNCDSPPPPECRGTERPQ